MPPTTLAARTLLFFLFEKSKTIIVKCGFGIVYKGHLQDGKIVAVKKLEDGNVVGGETQFQTEVEMISLAVDRNLLELYDFCMTATERLLVYPCIICVP